MTEKMVIEVRQGWDPSQLNKIEALYKAHEWFVFRDDRDIKEERDRYIVIYVKTQEPESPQEPILMSDYFKNTLSPIAEKGKQLLGGQKPVLKKHDFDGRNLVFVFSPVSSSSYE